MVDGLTFKDTYKYDSRTIAIYIVAWANEHNVSINLTKTQKLLYIAYGANLVLEKDRLCNEHPQAWPYGPVFPKTRDKLLKLDLSLITMDCKQLESVKDDEYLSELIQFVFSGFGDKTAGQLTAWSHSANSPWDITTRLSRFKWGMSIPDMYIQHYFANIINIEFTPDEG